MSSDTPIKETSSKRKYLLLLAAILLVAAGWSGAWAYGRSVLASQIDQKLAQVSDLGTEVNCRDLDIGGYPFRYEIYCKDLRAADLSGAESSVAGLNAVALVYNPWHVILEAKTPAAVSVPLKGFAGELSWETAWASAKYSMDSLGDVDVVLTQPELNFQNPLASGRAGSAKAELHLRASPDETGAVDGFVSIDGLTSELMPSLASPVDTRFHVRVRDAAPLLAGADLRWIIQELGGELPVRLELAEIAMGMSRFGASGDLTVNGAGALSGTLTLTLVQPDGFLKTIQPLFPAGSNEFSILESLLTSLKPTGTDHRGDPAIEFPLILDHGLMRVGFITLGRIPPLFQAGS
ncbi:DUF2125 domain-containing protein [Roseibium sp.]|uniref:DUF2125 domain-containing protein n=1 Tax=Roseibium sp. TaxID=1936156 RepID=UPI003B51ACE9